MFCFSAALRLVASDFFRGGGDSIIETATTNIGDPSEAPPDFYQRFVEAQAHYLQGGLI